MAGWMSELTRRFVSGPRRGAGLGLGDRGGRRTHPAWAVPGPGGLEAAPQGQGGLHSWGYNSGRRAGPRPLPPCTQWAALPVSVRYFIGTVLKKKKKK